jgi:hypothetical protein
LDNDTLSETFREPDNHTDLENVAGGTDLSPAVIMYAKQLIAQFKSQGYTREQLIEELKNRGISEEYWPMILEYWDSLS